MQFKHPEILFFLFLLLIPLLIHLFQLQKFKKEAFTNVKFLKEIELETRKSSKLKKLLILLSRMLTFMALVIAFSQPFINKNKDLQERKSIFYIDNSLSMQAKGSNGVDKLELTKNYLLDKLDEMDGEVSLITNQKSLSHLDQTALKRALVELEFFPLNKDINQVLFQINNELKNESNTLFDVYLISDFQNINKLIDTSLIHKKNNYSLVNLSDITTGNISLDSVWITKNNGRQISLKAKIRSERMEIKDLSISLFLNEQLYGKTTVSLKSGETDIIDFLIPASPSDFGRISFTDHSLNFDNELFFSIPQKQKSKVLVIGLNNNFLDRIYNPKEFALIKSSFADLDQSIIPGQDLIILDELEKISNPLIQSLAAFVQNKGNLVIIPAEDANIDSYNKLFEALRTGGILERFEKEKSVNRINYDHPFFDQVFEKEVYNFEYPILASGYMTNFQNASTLLQFEDQTDFVTEIKYFDNKVYWISSHLSAPGNNFVNSPLIVPLFYNFSVQNKNDKAIYLTIGQRNEIIVEADVSDEEALKIVHQSMEFIPMQIRSSERIKVTTEDYPLLSGLYELKSNEELLKTLAFNYDRIESNLNYSDLKPLTNQFENIYSYNSLDTALKEGIDRNNNRELWQLFIIFALVFLILEILLQKFLKN